MCVGIILPAPGATCYFCCVNNHYYCLQFQQEHSTLSYKKNQITELFIGFSFLVPLFPETSADRTADKRS